MRIAIDMQGAQGAGRFRGIGRYTLALADGLIRVNTEHEIILVLNGLFPESVTWLKAHFKDMLPDENIRVWTAPGPVDFLSGISNTWRREAAEIVREAFFACINPDVVLVSSMIEGIGDNCVTSIGKFRKTPKVAAIVYDFIYLLYPDIYLANPNVRHWYTEKLCHLKNADLFLSISESSRQEAIQKAHIPEDKIFNISTAADPKFIPSKAEPSIVNELLKKIRITKPFVLYCGGSDARKNLPRLISAFSRLPEPLRNGHHLLIVGAIPQQDINALAEYGRQAGLSSSHLIISGYLDDDSIIALYGACKCFVLPSWHEGFGLPALEAMSCGAPVIGSNTSSIPEVIGNPEALFDPFDEKSISKKIAQVLSDEKFRKKLIQHGSNQIKHFSWDLTAKRALTALETMVSEGGKPSAASPDPIGSLVQAISKLSTRPTDQNDLLSLAAAVDVTFPEASLQ